MALVRIALRRGNTGMLFSGTYLFERRRRFARLKSLVNGKRRLRSWICVLVRTEWRDGVVDGESGKGGRRKG